MVKSSTGTGSLTCRRARECCPSEQLVPDNVQRALEALQTLGYEPGIPVEVADFADPEIRASWIGDEDMVDFQMYGDRSRVTVDIFVEHPMPFDAL